MEIITKLASSPHILQHMNAAKYGFSEGICGEIPRFFAPWGQKWLPQQTRGSSQGCRILKCDTPFFPIIWLYRKYSFQGMLFYHSAENVF